jgi:ketosteroid isomerase-like protein
MITLTSRAMASSTLGLALALALPLTLDAQDQPDDQAAVLAVADSALAAISRSDFAAFTDLMLDSAVTFSAGERNGQYRIQFRTRAQQRAIPPGGGFTERGFHPEVRVSGPLAMVWLPYDFYRDGKWSHCGVDVFTLLKSESGWRIATLVWSVEQPPACQRHPAGPPPGAAPN